MTKFLEPSFSSRPNNKNFDANYDRTFGKYCTWNDDGSGEECTKKALKGHDWCKYHLDVTGNLPESDDGH